MEGEIKMPGVPFTPQEKQSRVDSLRKKINEQLIPELEETKKSREDKIEEIMANRVKIAELNGELFKLENRNADLQNNCANLGNSIKLQEKKIGEVKASLLDAILES